MIRLTCEQCGQQISVQDQYAGKQIKCPACQYLLSVPAQTTEPETSVPYDKENDESEEHFEQLQIGSIKEFKQPPNVVTERTLPWVLDIFLYPLNVPGMTALGIVVFTRFFFWITVLFLREAAQQFLPCIAFFGLMFAIGVVVRIILYTYLCWYLCECVRGSAVGGVRATETKGYTPGLGEILGQTIKVAACLLLYAGPATIYFIEAGKTDAIFWSLFVFALVLLPMSFLATAVFESWLGLNPLLLIGSIFSTFLPYLAMILTFMAAGIVIIERAPNPKSSWSTFFVTWLAGVYLSMVVAHLLGGFYHRYEEKLNWDV